MNRLTINRNIQIRISVTAHKFISSLAVNTANHVPTSTQFDPLGVFNAKSRHCNIKNTHLLKNDSLRHLDIFVANSLLHSYWKSGAVVNARELFDTIPKPNVISWNIMISGCNRNLLFADSWSSFCRMRLLGFEPNEFTYGSVLSACTALQATIFGGLVYALAVKNGFFFNGYVRVGMIDLFAKSGGFEEALKVFSDVCCDNNVVCWNAIISGSVKNAEYWRALDIFCRMCRMSLEPNSFTFSSVFTACSALEELEIGRGVHAHAIKCSAKDTFVCTAIVDLYAKCGDIDEALKEFSRMPERNVVSWTAIISGFVKNNDSASALEIFNQMINERLEINRFTLTSVITACAKLDMIKEAMQIHLWILKSGFHMDPVIGSALINMYSKIGAIDLSEKVFREIEYVKNPSTWAVMISSAAQNQNSWRAIELYQRMGQDGLKPDTFCSSSVLSVVDCLQLGRQIHGHILKTGLLCDLSVGSSLFTMYSKCGSLEDSFEVFKQIPVRDDVSWASMIAGLTEHNCADHAIELFREMLSEKNRPDQMTLTSVLTAFTACQSLQKGKEIHGYALRAGVAQEPLVGSALVTLYVKCGAVRLATAVFDILPQKDQVSCSALVSGYAQNGLHEDAVTLFHKIWISGISLDSFTLSSVLGAVALLNRPAIETQLHGLATKLGLDSDVSVGSSLATMYSKSGSMENCQKAFDQIHNPDLVSWSAMIGSYARHGQGAEALKVYEVMRKQGVKPDSVTFVGILSACSHNGLLEEGYFHFNSMVSDFGIQPNYHHYACMVDLLGRSGRLKEAEKFISDMSIEPNALVWATLLAACKVHGDVELGKLAAKKVTELKPSDTAAYVSLSNICAEVGLWEDVLELRSLMKDSGLSKEPGWSFM